MKFLDFYYYFFYITFFINSFFWGREVFRTIFFLFLSFHRGMFDGTNFGLVLYICFATVVIFINIYLFNFLRIIFYELSPSIPLISYKASNSYAICDVWCIKHDVWCARPIFCKIWPVKSRWDQKYPILIVSDSFEWYSKINPR